MFSSLRGEKIGQWTDDCDVARENCCKSLDDAQLKAVIGYQKNLTSKMDVQDGCCWIFVSDTTRCYYSNKKENCKRFGHNNESCKENKKDFLVHENYNTSECTLELLNVQFEDGGNYTQKTKTFEFTLNLEVTANRDWVNPSIYVGCTLAVVLVVGLFSWFVYWFMKRRNKRMRKKEEAIFSVLHDANDEAFEVQSQNIDVLGSADKDGNTILHLVGMLHWSEKKTNMILEYCQRKHQDSIPLHGDLVTSIINLPPLKTRINSKNNKDETPLYIAAKYGKTKVVESLLEIENVDINAKSCKENDSTPLHQAAYKGHKQVVQKLVEDKRIERIDVKTSDGRTPLFCAASTGKIEAFQFLLEKEAKLDERLEEGENILHLLCNWGNPTLNKDKLAILKLIFNHIDTNGLHDMKESLLQQINLKENEEEGKILQKISDKVSLKFSKQRNKVDLEKNDTILYKTQQIGKPLEISVESGFFHAAKLLIENGANIKDLTLAQVINGGKAGHKQFAEYLLKENPQIVTEIPKNLENAVKEFKLNAVRLLISLDSFNYSGDHIVQFAKNLKEQNLSVEENERLGQIILELSKERGELSQEEIKKNIEKCHQDKQTKKQIIEKIKGDKNKEIEVHMKQLKKLTKDERSWMKKLKRTEVEEEMEEEGKTDEMKSRNPTMETIQKRVNDMIQAEKLLTTGQICQILNILNDEVTLQASSSK